MVRFNWIIFDDLFKHRRKCDMYFRKAQNDFLYSGPYQSGCELIFNSKKNLAKPHPNKISYKQVSLVQEEY